MPKPLRVLMVEDNPDDALLLELALERGGFDVRHARVETAGALRQALHEQAWDLVVCDHDMPAFDAPSALRVVRGSGFDMPFIIVSGTMGEDVAVEALKQGADDYLVKQNLKRLIPAVTRSLQEAENRRRRSAAERANQLIMANSVDVICITDAATRFVSVSDAARAAWGYEPAELIGRHWFDFVPAEDRAAAEQAYRAVRAGSVIRNLPSRIICRDGTLAEVVWTSSWSPRDRLCFSVARDVGQQRQAAEALEASEQKYRTYVQNAPLGVFVADESLRLLEVNAAVCALLGHEAEQICGRQLVEFVAPSDVEPLAESFAGLLERVGHEGEFRVLDSRGTALWIQLRAVRLAAGRVLGFCQDITSRREQERRRAESEAQYRAVIETCADGFCITSTEGQLLEVNDAMLALTGYSRHELLGMTVPDLVERPREAVLERLRLIVSAGTSQFETLYRTRDGRLLAVEVTSSTWPIAGGRIFSFVRDIRKRKLSETLLQARVRLSELALHCDLKELLQATLNEGELLTGSRIGFFHFVERDQEMISLQAWSARTLNDACKAEGEGLHYPISRAGVWAECVRTRRPVVHNDYASLPDRKGLPEGHAPVTRELTVPVLRDGKVVAIIGVGNKATDYDDDDTRVISELAVMVLDLVERKRAIEALRDSEQRFRAMVETSFEVFWHVDADMRIVYVSPKLERLTSLQPGALMGRKASEFMTEASARQIRHVAATVLAAREPLPPTECEFITSNGRTLVLELSGVPVFNAQGQFEGYRGSARDITESKAAEITLRESELRFRTAVENVPAGLFVQVGGRFVYANRCVAAMLRAASPEALLGSTVIERVHPESRTAVAARMHSLDNSAEPVPLIEEHWLRLDGSSFLAEVSAVPFTFEGRRGALVFMLDISERKRLTEQFYQAQKMEAVGQLSGGIAHDFNNILTVILGHTGLLETSGILDPGLRDSFTEIGRAAERASNLTRQLLLFSRRQTLQLRSLDLNESVRSTTSMLDRILGEDIQLKIDCHPDRLMLTADPGMLDQILLNLAVNARDAMPKGGQLLIRTSAVDLDEAQAERQERARAGRFTCLSVSDTGAGIPPDVLPHIFEPFFTTKPVGKGTGLGLATVFGIVEQHKGWVSVDSRPGSGTTFHVFLPRSERDMTHTSQRADQPAPAGGHETILLVEDEPPLRALVTAVLARQGYRVLPAASAASALEIWAERSAEIELLVTDIVLPGGMSGIELADRLLVDKPKLRIVYSSGYSAELTARGLQLGPGMSFLAKPYVPSTLIEVVRRCLDADQGLAG